jgi:hypothetical protein
MVPSAWQPFHYYQILVVEKKYTHMSIGITDRDWEVRICTSSVCVGERHTAVCRV